MQNGVAFSPLIGRIWDISICFDRDLLFAISKERQQLQFQQLIKLASRHLSEATGR